MHHFLVDLLIFLSAAVIAVPLFKFFKIAPLLAYLIAGILIGPEVFSFIKDPKTILHFSELGVVFLLFLIGLELKPQTLWKMRQTVFGMGALQVLITGFLLMFIAKSLGLSTEVAFVCGFGLALSSTAFALQILEEKRQLKTLHGQGSFSILLFQDIAVVPLIAIIPLLKSSNSLSSHFNFDKLMTAIYAMSALILVGYLFVRYFFRFIAQARVQEVFTATALLIVVGSAMLMEYAGLSMGLGAFLAGVLLANSEYRHELEINLEPFKGLLLGLFFIAVGMSLDLGVVSSMPYVLATLVLSFMVIKSLLIFSLARLFKFPYESARNMAFTLPQGGEFAFVLFSLAFAANILDSELNSLLNTAVTISMALTPLIFALNQKYLRTFHEVSEKPDEKIESEGATVIIAGYGRFGQIVSRMLRSQGIQFTILEHSAAQVETARKFGAKIYYGDATRKDIVTSAGAKDARTFVLAIDDPETSIRTAKMIRENFPHLVIIARARNRQHVMDLMELGITNIHRETYLTSLEVSKEVLKDLGFKLENINKKLALFRKHDEEILKKQYDLRHSEAEMISFTKKASADLEDILKEDNIYNS